MNGNVFEWFEKAKLRLSFTLDKSIGEHIARECHHEPHIPEVEMSFHMK